MPRVGTLRRLLSGLRRSVEERLLRAAAQAFRWIKSRPEHARLAALSEREHDARWREDLDSLRLWTRGLERVTRRAERARGLFSPRGGRLPTFEERARLRGFWSSFLDYLVALDGLKFFHSGFPGIPLDARRPAHARSYLIAYAAFLSQYSAGLRLIRLVLGRRAVETLLDEAAPEHGLPAGQYAKLKWNVLHVADVTKLLVGEAYLDLFRDELGRDREARRVLALVRRSLPRVKEHLAGHAVRYFAANAAAIFRSTLFRAWFPVQRGVARWMGEVTVKDRPPLVTRAQAAALARRLRPGDVLVERRNWHLSNVGLPGFWPHAALYVGTPSEISAALGAAFLRRLRRRHPEKLAKFASRPYRVIEAVAEGVTFKTIEDSAGADYVGVLRPRRGAAVAVERAFHYHGRPYDFDFDFESDAALVCSELVYKGYQGAVHLPLVEVAGRRVLPPNEIVRKFDREHGTPRQELDFVCFLDGIEAERRAVPGTLQAFRRSHLRPKWDFLQK
jgi:hypothetical protein